MKFLIKILKHAQYKFQKNNIYVTFSKYRNLRHKWHHNIRLHPPQQQCKTRGRHQFSLSTTHPLHMVDCTHRFSIFILNKLRSGTPSLSPVFSMRRRLKSEREASETTDTGQTSAKTRERVEGLSQGGKIHLTPCDPQHWQRDGNTVPPLL